MAQQPGVGAVGARLLYPDGHSSMAGSSSDWAASRDIRTSTCLEAILAMRLARDSSNQLSAVTAACLLIKRKTYEEVGGLDEVNFESLSTMSISVCGSERQAIGTYGRRMQNSSITNQQRVETRTRQKSNARFEREVKHYMRATLGWTPVERPCIQPEPDARLTKISHWHGRLAWNVRN